jgi:hypothetical protein
LPELPHAIRPAIGFPSAETGPASILITKTDWADVVSFAEQLNAWVAAATACMQAGGK